MERLRQFDVQLGKALLASILPDGGSGPEHCLRWTPGSTAPVWTGSGIVRIADDPAGLFVVPRLDDGVLLGIGQFSEVVPEGGGRRRHSRRGPSSLAFSTPGTPPSLPRSRRRRFATSADPRRLATPAWVRCQEYSRPRTSWPSTRTTGTGTGADGDEGTAEDDAEPSSRCPFDPYLGHTPLYGTSAHSFVPGSRRRGVPACRRREPIALCARALRRTRSADLRSGQQSELTVSFLVHAFLMEESENSNTPIPCPLFAREFAFSALADLTKWRGLAAEEGRPGTASQLILNHLNSRNTGLSGPDAIRSTARLGARALLLTSENCQKTSPVPAAIVLTTMCVAPQQDGIRVHSNDYFHRPR